MLEKNKDYVEFTLQCSSVDFGKSKDHPAVCLNGYSDADFPCVPMEVVCKRSGHKVVMISKRDFDRLQANVDINAELAKQWEINYDLLLKKTGFDTVESLVFYLTNVGCDTLLKTLASYIFERDNADENYNLLLKKTGFTSVADLTDYICDSTMTSPEDKTLKEIIDDCEKDYISERDKAEALEKEIDVYSRALKDWKEGTDCPSPSTAKSLLKHYCEENKKLQKKINELRDDISGRSTVIEHYKRDIEKWQKATGCISPEDISTSSLISKATVLEQELNILNGALQEWKEVTGYPSPSAAKVCIESGASWCHAYNEVKEKNQKLTEEVDSWKNITGYSTPEDYMHVRINNATPFDYTAAWQKVTGFSTPEKCSSYIDTLEKKLEDIKDLIEED